MNTIDPVSAGDRYGAETALSWSAILAGAAAAAALSLILLILGAGLGLSSVSPWARAGVGAATFGISTILWITLTQVLASGMGGYLAGRLRTKWLSVHLDEAHFRDTVHGFLAWSIASLVTASVLASAVGAIFSGGATAGASIAGGAVNAAAVAGKESAGSNKADGEAGPTGYFVDSLFRKDPSVASATTNDDSAAAGATSAAAMPVNTSAQSSAASNGEVTRIIANALHSGTLPPDDVHYLGQLVAQRTGISQPDAEKRVSDTFTRLQQTIHQAEDSAKDAADKARKASATAALWLFVSLLAGAFFASFAAVHGGRQRDRQTIHQY